MQRKKDSLNQNPSPIEQLDDLQRENQEAQQNTTVITPSTNTNTNTSTTTTPSTNTNTDTSTTTTPSTDTNTNTKTDAELLEEIVDSILKASGMTNPEDPSYIVRKAILTGTLSGVIAGVPAKYQPYVRTTLESGELAIDASKMDWNDPSKIPSNVNTLMNDFITSVQKNVVPTIEDETTKDYVNASLNTVTSVTTLVTNEVAKDWSIMTKEQKASEIQGIIETLTNTYSKEWEGMFDNGGGPIIAPYLTETQKLALLTTEEKAALALTTEEKKAIETKYRTDNNLSATATLTAEQQTALNDQYTSKQNEKYLDSADEKLAGMPSTDQIALLSDEQLMKFLKDDDLNFDFRLATNLTAKEKKAIEDRYRADNNISSTATLTAEQQTALNEQYTTKQTEKTATFNLTDTEKKAIEDKYRTDNNLSATATLTAEQQTALNGLYDSAQKDKYVAELNKQLSSGELTMQDLRKTIATSLASADQERYKISAQGISRAATGTIIDMAPLISRFVGQELVDESVLTEEQKLALLTTEEKAALALTTEEKKAIETKYRTDNNLSATATLTTEQTQALNGQYTSKQNEKYLDKADEKLAGMTSKQQIALLSDEQLDTLLKTETMIKNMSAEDKATLQIINDELNGIPSPSETDKKILMTQKKEIAEKTLDNTRDPWKDPEDVVNNISTIFDTTAKAYTENLAQYVLEPARGYVQSSVNITNSVLKITTDGMSKDWANMTTAEKTSNTADIIGDSIQAIDDNINFAKFGPWGTFMEAGLKIVVSLTEVVEGVAEMVQNKKDKESGKITEGQYGKKNGESVTDIIIGITSAITPIVIISSSDTQGQGASVA